MKGQRMAMYAGLLATAIGISVAGVAARAITPDQDTQRRDRREDRQVFVMPGDRQVIRLDGRGSQIGVLVSDPEAAGEAGAKIDRVDDGSPAAKAGVKEGDRVVEFDGERVRSTRQLTRLVQETPSGRAVKMTVQRGADRRTLDITPEADRLSSLDMRLGPELEREIERGVEQGLRDLPRRIEPFFDFNGRLPTMGARGRLGVQVQPLNDQLAEYFGVKDGGVLVNSVTAESPAAKAGLKAGDVITKVNGDAVKDPGDLVRAIGESKDGAVAIDLVRDKKASSVKATIEAPKSTRPARGARPA